MINGPVVHEMEVRRSRFICAAGRVATEPEARAFIAARRDAHRAATHHCTAYVVGDHGEITKSNDDGEPPGTAGMPMLSVLKQRRLTGVVAVVTRYFGGVKLGAGGLARAYGQAVSEALDLAGTAELVPAVTMTVTLGHARAGRFQRDLHASPYVPGDIRYGAAAVEIDVVIPEAEVAAFTAWAAGITSGEAKIAAGGHAYLERPGRPLS